MFFNQFEALLFYLHPLSVHAHFAVSCIDLFKIDDGPVIKQGGFVFGSFSLIIHCPATLKGLNLILLTELKLVLALEKENLIDFFLF